MASNNVVSGCVKWFNSKQKYGFITVTSEGEHKNVDIFVHQSNLNTKEPCYRFLVAGENVNFEKIAANDEKIAIYGRLKDKFGDNGLISVMIGSVHEGCCYIDVWLMSCRVLKRNMEHAMLDEFIRISREKGVKRIYGTYVKTSRNEMVSDLYTNFSFKKIKGSKNLNRWSLDVIKEFNYNDCIKVKHD